ncbi:Putative 2-hydroxyacid dehydrogenase [archaeon HR06]|nr:Putative 2-hydroxyacid dehydrogenase [archaeon HR06]
MRRPKVYVTRRIPSPGIELLEELCEVKVNPFEEPPKRDILLDEVKDIDGLLCLLTEKIDEELMDKAKNLKVVSTMSVGYDHIKVEEATKRGIYVCYTPGVLTEATADFTWALILASARRLVEADRYIREGKWKIAWSPTLFLGEDVYGRTLGIIGLGRIGSAVARRARGFNMKILYYDVVRAKPEVERELGITFVTLEELLKESDFVSIHVPLTKETYHLLNEEKLKMMKPTAILVNTARGAIIDQKALAKALKEGWISYAGLDVFEKEPIDMKDELLNLNNVILAPHIASATKQARSKMAELASRNLLAVLKGEMPLHLVNKEVIKVRPLSEVKVI